MAGTLVAAQPQALNLSMPFGAEVVPDGVRFRLWAPGAKSVSLVTDREVEMRGRDGWFELTDKQAKAGTRYQYRIDGEMLVPDPASRFQPEDVDGPSEVIDPAAFHWE